MVDKVVRYRAITPADREFGIPELLGKSLDGGSAALNNMIFVSAEDYDKLLEDYQNTVDELDRIHQEIEFERSR